MAVYITDECINCHACVSECPNEAISEGVDIYVIDPDRCTECVGFHNEPACQTVCPKECCLSDPSRVEDEAALHARAVRLHPELDGRELTSATSRFRLPVLKATGR
jgi:ferredoxin